MFKKIICCSSIALLFICLPITTFASAWILNEDNSTINFVTVKQTDTSESHVFRDFSGTISADKQAEIIIRPASIDTIVPERSIEYIQSRRNDRMRELLFETSLYPEIKIIADISKLEDMTAGDTRHSSFSAILSMHGVDQAIALNTIITQVNDSKMTVVSSLPIIVTTDDFNMNKGLNKLKALVGGIAIGKSVPVNFFLTFTR